MSSKVDPKKAKQDVSSKSKGKVGDWVRHISSSGKEYYYNVNTHASQWEKPREWLDYEKRYGPVPNQPSSSSKPPSHQQAHQQNQSSSSSASSHNSAAIHQQQSERERVIEQQREWYSSNMQQMRENANNTNNFSSSTSSYGHHPHSQSASQSHHLQHSTHTHHQQQQQQQHSHGGSHQRVNQYQQQQQQSQQQTSQQQQQQQRHPSQHYDPYGHDRHHSSSTYGHHAVSGLGRIAPPEATPSSSRHSSVVHGGMRDSRKQSEDLNSEDMDISPENSNSPLSVKSSSISGPGGGITSTSQHNISLNDLNRDRDNRDRDRDNRDRERERDMRDRDMRDRDRDMRDRDNRDREEKSHRNGIRDRLGRDRENNRNRDQGDSRDRGRPRERDRESRDHERSRSHLRDDRSQSPWDKDGTPERQDSGEASMGVNSMGRLSSGLGSETETSALAPLPSSLALYYREDLVAHVKNLPGDAAERQATKMGEEMLAASAIQLSKVSTELKMARSLVRLTDIQATLQEQRILFLREQIRNLEESEKDNSAMLGV